MHRLLTAASAVFLAGCGVDYQKCEAIREAGERAQAARDEAANNVIATAQASYAEKYCGTNPANTDISNQEWLAKAIPYMECKENAMKTYLDQAVEEASKDVTVIEATSRRDKIIDDFKWNRCK
jgi:hypothetical protein